MHIQEIFLAKSKSRFSFKSAQHSNCWCENCPCLDYCVWNNIIKRKRWIASSNSLPMSFPLSFQCSHIFPTFTSTEWTFGTFGRQRNSIIVNWYMETHWPRSRSFIFYFFTLSILCINSPHLWHKFGFFEKCLISVFLTCLFTWCVLSLVLSMILA